MTLTAMTMNMKITDTNIEFLHLGTDIIEVDRIRSSLRKHSTRFLSKIFTQNEQNYCLKHLDPSPYLAARFAAKEAVAKALGTGLGRSLAFLDIEIHHDSSGKPFVTLSKQATVLFPGIQLEISLSHCKSFATATALAYKATTAEKKG